MALRIIRLEQRLLFDASAAAVIADAANIDAAAEQQHVEATADSDGENTPEATLDSPAIPTEDVTILVISSQVEHSQELAALAADDVSVVIYDAENDNLEEIYSKIQEILGNQKADTIGFATPGDRGLLHLTQDIYVTAEQIDSSPELQAFWQNIGSLLGEDGRVDLLGSDIAKDSTDMLEAISTLSDADVAASTDSTDNNWILEAGDIDASLYFTDTDLAEWSGSLSSLHILDTPIDAVQNDQVNVLFVASHIQNADILANAAADGVLVIQYDSRSATLDSLYNQLRLTLNGREADSIGFATHGDNGLFLLTHDNQVSAYTLANNTELRSFWGNVGELMADGGRIDLLGCSIADGDKGLLAALDSALEASGKSIDIAASNDMTGNYEGENWKLEHGNIDAASYFNEIALAEWSGHLVTYTVTNTNNSGTGSLREAITLANASAGADLIIFDSSLLNANGGLGSQINLTSDLPSITEALEIRGGGTIGNIKIGIHNTGSATDGFSINAPGEVVTIDGMAITNFTDDNINLDNGTLVFINSQSGLTYDNQADGAGDKGIAIQGGTLYFGTNLALDPGLSSMSIHNPDDQIRINGGSNHQIRNSFIGVREDGVTIGPGGDDGIESSAANVTIDGNILRGGSGSQRGIRIDGNDVVINNNIISDWQGGGGMVLAADRALATNNTVYDNAGAGIRPNGTGADGNVMLQNSTYRNGLPGHELRNSANNNTNTPTGISVNLAGGEITISGTYNEDATSESTFTLEYYITEDVGFDEQGQYYLGSEVVDKTISNFSKSFDITSFDPGDYYVSVAATIFDNLLGTSNFSATNAASRFTITVPPVVDLNGPAGGSDSTAAFTEDSGGAFIAPNATITDSDSSNLTKLSATITNRLDGDANESLLFIDQNGITGSYDAATGTLTLSGTASVSAYELALQGIVYNNISGNPDTTARIINVIAYDEADSAVQTSTISITPVNSAPEIVSNETLEYVVEDSATPIDASITLTDPDSSNIASATVQISGNYVNGEDILGFSDTANITGSFNASTGTLTLTGSDTVANYEAALQSVTYFNSSGTPSFLSRTVSFTANDGELNSQEATATVDILASDPPTVTAGGAITYIIGDPATTIDGSITVSDSDDTNLQGAEIQITGNYVNGQDILGFTDTANISGSFDAATGTLFLTGTDTVAAYEAALQSITYLNSSSTPSELARTVSFSVNDGDNDSQSATALIGFEQNFANTFIVTNTNNTGTGSLNAAIALANGSAGRDLIIFDNALLTANGGLGSQIDLTTQLPTITEGVEIRGGGTVGNIKIGINNTGSVGYGFQVDASGDVVTINGFALSNFSDDGIQLDGGTAVIINTQIGLTFDNQNGGVNDKGIVINGDSILYLGTNLGLDPNLSSTIVNSGTYHIITSGIATGTGHQIRNSFLGVREDGVTTGAGGANAIELTTGSATIDGNMIVGSPSHGIRLTGPTHDMVITNNIIRDSTLRGISTSGQTAFIAYNEIYNNGDSGVAVGTASDGNIITQNSMYDNAPFGYTTSSTGNNSINTPSGITASINSGVLTIDGNYTPNSTSETSYIIEYFITEDNGFDNNGQYFLGSEAIGIATTSFSETFDISSFSPGDYYVSVTATIDDGLHGTSEYSTTTAAQRFTITDPPVVDLNGPIAGTGVSRSFIEDAGAIAIAPSAVITDIDSANLESMTITLTNRPDGDGNESLAFTSFGGITGSYNASTGELQLSGTASVADYQSTLQSVVYDNTSQNPTETNRIITISTSDGASNSSVVTSVVSITSVNDLPVVTAGGVLNYSENDAASVIDGSITVTDDDSATLDSATVEITANYENGNDILGFVDQFNITGSFDAGTGILTLSGTDTVANYEAALRSITFSNTSNSPSELTRTITYQVNDGEVDSLAANATVNVTEVNDKPIANAETATTVEGGTITTLDGGATSVLDNDTDLDLPNDTLTASLYIDVTHGTLTLNSDGTFEYTHNGNSATIDFFAYRAVDSSTATSNVGSVIIWINQNNDSNPDGADKTINLSENESYSFIPTDFGFSDTDPGDSLQAVRIDSINLSGGASLKALGSDVIAGQTISYANLISLQFRPGADENGASSFTFSVQDSGGNFDTAANTITLDVAAVASDPLGADTTLSITEDTPYTLQEGDFGFSDSDSETLQAIRIDSLSLPAGATLQLNGSNVGSTQIIAVGDIPNLVFSPGSDDFGSGYASFTFSVQDSSNAFSASSNTITFDVVSANDAPSASSNTITINEDTTRIFVPTDFSYSDIEGDNFKAVRIDSISLPGGATLNHSGIPVTPGQIINFNSIIGLQFRPALDANGSGYASFTFSVQDANDAFSSSQTITLDVTPVNDAPTGANNTVSTFENQDYTFSSADFGYSDVEGNGFQAVRIDTLSLDSGASLKLNGIDVDPGDIIDVGDIPLLVFSPATDALGSLNSSFSFSVQDSIGAFDSEANTLSIDIEENLSYYEDPSNAEQAIALIAAIGLAPRGDRTILEPRMNRALKILAQAISKLGTLGDIVIEFCGLNKITYTENKPIARYRLVGKDLQLCDDSPYQSRTGFDLSDETTTLVEDILKWTSKEQ